MTSIQPGRPDVCQPEPGPGRGLSPNGRLIEILQRLSLVLDAAQRDDRIAEQLVGEGLRKVQEFAARKPAERLARLKPPIALAKAGAVYEALAQIAAARDFYRRATTAWEQLPLPVRARMAKEDRDALSYAQSASERLPR